MDGYALILEDGSYAKVSEPTSTWGAASSRSYRGVTDINEATVMQKHGWGKLVNQGVLVPVTQTIVVKIRTGEQP